MYLTDLENNEVSLLDLQEDVSIFLHLKSCQMIGKTISVFIPETNFDYEYKGEILNKDRLDMYSIQSSHDKLLLKVVETRIK